MTRKAGGAGTLGLWLIMILVVLAMASNFTGPFKGWLTRMEKTEEVKADPAPAKGKDSAPANTDTPSDTDSANTETKPDVKASVERPETKVVSTSEPKKTAEETKAEAQAAKETEEDRLKSRFDKLVAEELQGLSRPKPGAKVTVNHNGRYVSGEIVVITKIRAILRTASGDSTVIKPSEVDDQGLRTLFPEAYAEKQATKILDAEAAEIARKKAMAEEMAKLNQTQSSTTTGTKTTTTTTTRKPYSRRPPLKYDPTYAKTPKKYHKPLIIFKGWLDVQAKRAGAPLASKIYAKDHDGRAVCYMVMRPFFTRQKKDVRETTAEMFWRQWSKNCKDVNRLHTSQSHVVLLDANNNIIGGSKTTGSSKIWVK